MFETLLTLLKVDSKAPTIILEEDGDMGLEYYEGKFSISINETGEVHWAVLDIGHGTDLNEFIELLEAHRAD